MKPSQHIAAGLRRALRRRYGYAALRTLRRALVRARARHELLTFGPRPYDGQSEREAIATAYWRALRRLAKRWPALDLEDDRARL